MFNLRLTGRFTCSFTSSSKNPVLQSGFPAQFGSKAQLVQRRPRRRSVVRPFLRTNFLRFGRSGKPATLRIAHRIGGQREIHVLPQQGCQVSKIAVTGQGIFAFQWNKSGKLRRSDSGLEGFQASSTGAIQGDREGSLQEKVFPLQLGFDAVAEGRSENHQLILIVRRPFLGGQFALQRLASLAQEPQIHLQSHG